MGEGHMCYYRAADDFERYNKRNVFWRIRQGLVLLSHVLCIFRAGKGGIKEVKKDEKSENKAE